MRTALCLYGHFRCFDACYPELYRNLILPNSIQHVFASSWLDSMGHFQHPENSDQPLQHVGYDTNSGVPSQEFLQSVYDRLNPAAVNFDHYSNHDPAFTELVERYRAFHHPSPSHRPKGTLSQVWQRSNSLKLCAEYEDAIGVKFDRIVCTRWDIAYTQPILLDTLDPAVISMDGMYGPTVISDAWACGPSAAMKQWSKQFLSIDLLASLGTLNLGPHEWLRAHFDCYEIPWLNRNELGIWIRR